MNLWLYQHRIPQPPMARCPRTIAASMIAMLAWTSIAAAADAPPVAAYDRDADDHQFTIFMQQGGWCWFQDPRAIVHDGHLLIGSVQGNGLGPARLGVYDLEHQRRLASFVVRDQFDRDDHNSPVFDSQGHPHIGYSLYLSNSDHRYRIASWDGRQWIDRDVAFAGTCLYQRESSYTGLITLDPIDPTVVVISTDVDPSTGTDHGGHHEIYRATVRLHDDVHSIAWQAVTRDSPVGNIRPVILRNGEQRVVLWNRGEFLTFTNYQLDTIGFIE